jgi:hypothetical protein
MKDKKYKKRKFVWGALNFSDPYKVIQAIFNYANIDSYRDFIVDILLYSTVKKHYKKKDPVDIMYIIEGIYCLLQACYVISKMKECCILEVRTSDVLNAKFYSLSSTELGQWVEFPRSLSKDEFLNPYKALKQVFRHYTPDKLYDIVKYLTENACGSYCDEFEINTFEIYYLLSKLFEASHLIRVRELDHIENWRVSS